VQRISISPDGKFVFAQDQETPRVVVIDTATNAVVRSISLPRIVFSSIITKDGQWLLANSESGKLFVVDLASGAVAKTFDTPDVPVLPTPGEFALSSDGTHAYVSCPQGGTIEILNLKDWKLEEPIRSRKASTAWLGCLPLHIDRSRGSTSSRLSATLSFPVSPPFSGLKLLRPERLTVGQ
jgi:YVTN family beta-propeller protein